ncbi:hypothetical protein KQI41_01105 [Tissierella pigra]|uniref:hypothetical protein n=1 Tax=Tissierella pigra TaxID=2607614 RepID=UPI001C128619|nr:hypothetical protein [Tissierella pigra]MBU5424993.1 hypothetical protein [Tissierella pigra]
MQDLNIEMNKLRNELNLAIEFAKKRGQELAKAERDYRIALAKKILIERDNKVPVTIISDICRGDTEIAELKFNRDALEVLYKSAGERINATKLEIRIVEGQMESMRKGV